MRVSIFDKVDLTLMNTLLANVSQPDTSLAQNQQTSLETSVAPMAAASEVGQEGESIPDSFSSALTQLNAAMDQTPSVEALTEQTSTLLNDGQATFHVASESVPGTLDLFQVPTSLGNELPMGEGVATLTPMTGEGTFLAIGGGGALDRASTLDHGLSLAAGSSVMFDESQTGVAVPSSTQQGNILGPVSTVSPKTIAESLQNQETIVPGIVGSRNLTAGYAQTSTGPLEGDAKSVDTSVLQSVTSVLASNVDKKQSLVSQNPALAQSVNTASVNSTSLSVAQSLSPLNTGLMQSVADARGMINAVDDLPGESESFDDVLADVKTHTALVGNNAKAEALTTDKVMVQTTVRVGMPGWADQIAERTASLASQNIKQAEVQLNPQEMGPISVKISVANEQAAVTFVAQNAAVRDALDQAMQRLKDTFDSEGMELVQADVHDQQHTSGDEAEEEANLLTGSDSRESEGEAEQQSEVIQVDLSAVDHYV